MKGELKPEKKENFEKENLGGGGGGFQDKVGESGQPLRG